MKKVVLLTVLCMLFAVSAFAQSTKEVKKEVSRHTFTSGIADREPTDSLKSYIPTEGETVYYFTELSNLQNTKVKHVWYKNNELVFQKEIDVKGARWRYPTSMKAGHFKKGDIIKVEVIAEDGSVLVEDTLDIE